MSKNNCKHDLSYTQNRELSWLEFNRRVLEEAMDESVPLLERFKFISIFSSNLDEFFMVRVGSLFDLSMMTPSDTDNKSGKTPSEQLEAIFTRVAPLIKYRDIVYDTLSNDLRSHGIADISYSELSKEDKKYIEEYYRMFIRPILSPQIIDNGHPFPHLKNKALYIAAILKKDKSQTLGIIDIPAGIKPIINLKSKKGIYIRTENVIKEHISDFFGIYEILDSAAISVTRNADISFDEEKFDEEASDFSSRMSKLLKKRDRLAPVRIEIEGFSDVLAHLLAHRLSLKKHQVFHSVCPLNLSYAFDLKELGHNLYYAPYTPVWPSYILSERPMEEQIKKRDILLFYPYNSIKPFLKLLRESADSKDVISIKITLYRLAENSEVAKHLCRAAENGKDVTVLVELRARFDEKNNIEWAKRLSEAGCRIIYGMEGYKCHSKICLITKREKSGFSYITQVGTGNYNEKTACLYTDFCFITSDNAIAKDACAFFQNMLTGSLDGTYEKLLVAPNSMKNVLVSLIEREAQKGRDGRIIIKANSVTERELIDKLSEASSKGVKIHLIIRGICCILPGIAGKTENITVTSIVGRFLEHSRVYLFGNGNDETIFISSADIMTRNQTRRVEIACPIENPEIKKWIRDYLNILLKDNTKARMLMPDGTYIKKAMPVGSERINSQKWFLEHPPEFERTNTAPSIKMTINKILSFFKVRQQK